MFVRRHLFHNRNIL